MLSLCDSSHKARASVRLHLGEVGLCVVAIDAELGLDAECNPAELCSLRGHVTNVYLAKMKAN